MKSDMCCSANNFRCWEWGLDRRAERRGRPGCRPWLAFVAPTHLHLTFVLLFFVMSNSIDPVNACCVGDSGPLSDCSFTRVNSELRENVTCTLKDFRRRDSEGCTHNHWTEKNDEIPGNVHGLKVEYYLTQCNRSLREERGQKSDRCPSSCNANNGLSYIAINITFKLDYTSASKVEAIEIELRGLDGDSHGRKQWCVLYEYGRGNVQYDDATNRLFYYDGFIGLVPGFEYEVAVRGLPTADLDQRTWVKKKFRTRPCWSPFLTWHGTPFAANFTMILNNHADYKKDIDEYNVSLHTSSDQALSYEIIQNNQDKTEIVFECLEPGPYVIKIQARGTCKSCVPYKKSFNVSSEKPQVTVCPENITRYTEIRGNTSVTWPAPLAISPCEDLASINSSQSHHSGDIFEEGTTTEVRYEFWQYNQEERAVCSFYIKVLSDTEPPVVTCSNVTLPSESPNFFSGLVEGESYTYDDNNPDPDGVSYNFTKDMDLMEGVTGTIIPPGETHVTLVAKDTFGNTATCVFYVKNALAELPVNCPHLEDTAITDPGRNTYTFDPNIGESNITKSLPGYIYYGDKHRVALDMTLGGFPVGSNVPIGSHEMVVLIRDEVLTKTCRSICTVKERPKSNGSVPVPIIVGSVLGFALALLVFFIVNNCCQKVPGRSRLETCKERFRLVMAEKHEENETQFSRPQQDTGIDLQLIKDAPSVNSSSTNIKDLVMVWFKQHEDQTDSGCGTSLDPRAHENMQDDSNPLHGSEGKKMLKCEVHLDSGVDIDSSGNFRHDKGYGSVDGIREASAGTCSPLMNHQDAPL
ncbi:uncharacterized protein LOC121424025 [Lytechinus variegatus]|uniref:uncharacterized protein LOC121424025 n=1 Tax=Lytechinus variegatus TaxID=7654 RepID=UPI001BB2AFDD|nr:uncharacterized protein LOC121424025 [Lytechinus variegatus]